MTTAEAELTGGASPRVSPFPELRDLAGLLSRAGFTLAVADAEEITLAYADPFTLLRELRDAGEANAVAQRSRRPAGAALFGRAASLLPQCQGRYPARLLLATMTGWAG